MIIRNRMYGGEVELVFDDLMHRYTIEGVKVPSVTSILGIVAKPALMFWAANMAADYFKACVQPGVSYDEVQLQSFWSNAKKAHAQKKEDASTVGSFTHAWVESFIKGEKPELPVNPQVRGSVERFMSWVKDHNVKFLSAEQPVYSRKNGYCGTADFFCVVDGKLLLGDLKTSNAMYYDSMGSQLAAYIMARKEEYPEEQFSGAVLVRVGKEDGELEIWNIDNEQMKLFEKNFTNCLNLYNSEEEVKKLYEKKR